MQCSQCSVINYCTLELKLFDLERKIIQKLNGYITVEDTNLNITGRDLFIGGVGPVILLFWRSWTDQIASLAELDQSEIASLAELDQSDCFFGGVGPIRLLLWRSWTNQIASLAELDQSYCLFDGVGTIKLLLWRSWTNQTALLVEVDQSDCFIVGSGPIRLLQWWSCTVNDQSLWHLTRKILTKDGSFSAIRET